MKLTWFYLRVDALATSSNACAIVCLINALHHYNMREAHLKSTAKRDASPRHALASGRFGRLHAIYHAHTFRAIEPNAP